MMPSAAASQASQARFHSSASAVAASAAMP